jgi:hypothetical protein
MHMVWRNVLPSSSGLKCIPLFQRNMLPSPRIPLCKLTPPLKTLHPTLEACVDRVRYFVFTMNSIGREIWMQTAESAMTSVYTCQWTWFSHKAPEMKLLYEDSFTVVVIWVNTFQCFCHFLKHLWSNFYQTLSGSSYLVWWRQSSNLHSFRLFLFMFQQKKKCFVMSVCLQVTVLKLLDQFKSNFIWYTCTKFH